MNLLSPTDATKTVQSALAKASRSTGAGFDYLLNTATRESALDPSAKAKTSSATGLFQFIESTWLEMVKEEGPKHGLQAYASTISRGADGQYRVANQAARQEILALRTNPETSATMAGELTRRNTEQLTSALGRKPSDGELYAAHVLGGEGATRLITVAAKNPDAPATALFPAEAGANRALFHEASGRPRTVAELYTRLTAAPASAGVSAAAAAAGTEEEEISVLSAFGSRYQRVARADAPVFHSMYSSAPGAAPVNAFVAHTWGGMVRGTQPEAAGTPPVSGATLAPTPAPRPSGSTGEAPAGRSQPVDLVPSAGSHRTGSGKSEVPTGRRPG